MGEKYNFNDAPPQRSGELIPAGYVSKMIMHIRPGGVGPEGWFTQSKTSDVQMLDAEFTLMEGEYDRRKFWQNMTLSGGSRNDKGQSKGGEISRALLRAILESSRNILPADMSEAALAARMAGFEDFDGIVFIGRVKIEKGTDGYPDKNVLAEAITPDMKAYGELIAGTYQQTIGGTGKAAGSPAWAPPGMSAGQPAQGNASGGPAPWGAPATQQGAQTASAGTGGAPWGNPTPNGQNSAPAAPAGSNPWGTPAPAAPASPGESPAANNVPGWAK